MKTDIDKLMKIKNEIDEAKTEDSEIKGQLISIDEQLSKEFDIDSIEDAEALVEKKDSAIDAMEEKFDDGLEKLEDAYEWDL